MHTARIVSTLALAWLLSACASGSYTREQLHQSVATGTGRALGSVQAAAAEWPPGVVVDDGVTTDEAAAIALWRNASFRAALAALELARADLADARALADPALSVVFPGNDTKWKGTVSWPIRLLQMPWRIRGAKLNADGTVQQLIERGRALERDAREAHAALLLARELRELRNGDAALARSIQSIAQLQFDAGRISRSELERLTIEAVTAGSLQLAAGRELAGAENNLLQLLGLGELQDHVQVVGEAPVLTMPELAAALSGGLESRAELLAAQAQLARAGENAGLQRAELLNIAALINLDQPRGAGVDVGPGVAVTLPIFNANRGARMRAAAELERAAADLLAVRQRVAAEIRTAHAALGAAVDAHHDLQQRALPASAAMTRQLEERLQGGRESSMSVMQARRTLVATQVAAAAATASVRQSRARLDYASGSKESK